MKGQVTIGLVELDKLRTFKKNHLQIQKARIKEELEKQQYEINHEIPRLIKVIKTNHEDYAALMLINAKANKKLNDNKELIKQMNRMIGQLRTKPAPKPKNIFGRWW